MMTLIIKNSTAQAQLIADLGLLIPASGQVDFTSSFIWARAAPYASTDLISAINGDLVVLNNGSVDISKANSVAYLHQFAFDMDTSLVPDTTNYRYCTDAQKTIITNTSGTNTGDVTLATNSGLGFGSGQTLLAMGAPTTCTNVTSNSVTTNTHAHAVTGFATGAGSASGANSVDVTLATNSGLAISGQQLNMGTPSTCTNVTTNAVTTNTHTHAITGFLTSIPNGNMLYVDAVNGNDSTGARGRFDLPYLTISAAITAASSGDLIRIRPGTYNETITCKSGVSIWGEDARNTIISRANSVSETVVTMADNIHFANLRINLAPSAGTTTGILMSGTTNSTSTLFRIRIAAAQTGSGIVTGLSITGTGVATNEHGAADCCVFMGGAASGYGITATGSGGTSFIQNSIITGGAGTGANIGASATLNLLGCKVTGTTNGLNIVSTGILNINQGSTYNSVTNAGTFQPNQISFPASTTNPGVTAYGTTATTACVGNDSRLSDSRAPTGSAGGDLASTYPNPTVAQSSTAFALNGVISPSSIGASQNDYNPTGLSGTSCLRLTASAAYNITGLAGGASGRIITIHNIGSFAITLVSESASSAAANRFSLTGDIVISTNECLILQYDNTSTRWRAIGQGVDPYGSVVSVGTANADGTSSTIARANHVHSGLTRDSGDFALFTEKTTLNNNDLFLMEDSENSNIKKKAKLSTLLTIPSIGASLYNLLYVTASPLPIAKSSSGGVAADVQMWSMAVFQNKLYVGTYNVTNATDSTAAKLIVYDGTSWSTITKATMNGTNGDWWMRSMAVYNNKLYIGTGNTTAATDSTAAKLLVFDGTTWSTITKATMGGVAADTQMDSMAVYDGALYIGTYNATAATNNTAAKLIKYDGSTWSVITKATMGGVNADVSIHSMAVYNNALFLGTQNATAATNNTGAKVITYNGTIWTVVTKTTMGGVNADVLMSSMAVFRGKLFVGTQNATANTNNTAAKLCVYCNGAWSILMKTDLSYGAINADTSFDSMAVYNGDLYLGMANTTAAVDSTAAKIFACPPGVDYHKTIDIYKNELGCVTTDQSFCCMAVYQGALYAGTYSTASATDLTGSKVICLRYAIAESLNNYCPRGF